MKIIDINGKTREAISVKVISWQIPDSVHGGIATTRKYAEVVIQGRTGRVWKEWYPLEDFIKNNPGVRID
jgi:hypothetical protein